MKFNVLTDGEEESLYHKRDSDFEPYDKITIELVPRYKTSGLSGDEWRTGVKTTLWFKGHPIVEEFNNSYDYALANLTALVADRSCPIETAVIKIEESSCDQPGCPERAVSRYRIKQEFSDRGEKLDMSDSSLRHYRQFCARHLERGDCSREDCDENYEVIGGGLGPDDSLMRPEDESPSAQLVVEVDSMDELPAAIDAAVRKPR